MTKIRKVKRNKKYLYNVNRKRLNKKRLPGSESATIKNAWNAHMSCEKNFRKMGLVFDVNSDIRCMNKESEGKQDPTVNNLDTSSIIQELEENVKSAKASIGKHFQFSRDQVDFLTYLLGKYGDDYKAMSRDKRNYLQHTWKQLRHKINLFKSIPQHYNEYLNRKN